MTTVQELYELWAADSELRDELTRSLDPRGSEWLFTAFAELAPSCSEGGVLGVLPGIVGSIQANEALKLALGIGETLVGRLLLFDALDESFTEVRLERNPDCPVCGEHPTITEYVDYVEFCAR
jgi:molybdopterin/thiamine biosynthesis adenylyltransferase